MDADPFAPLQAATRSHRRDHGCGAYTFADGPALTAVARSSGAGRMLELGTALGYTACCLAAGQPTAQVDTIERDPEHVRLARSEIAAVGLAGRISVHQGDFDRALPALPGPYGLVFFDGFAPDAALLDLLIARLGPGGTLVCANLQLADPETLASLMARLDDPARWRTLPSIEDGGTVVRVRAGRSVRPDARAYSNTQRGK